MTKEKKLFRQNNNKKFISLIKKFSGSLSDLRAVDKETLKGLKAGIAQIQDKVELSLMARIKQGHNKKMTSKAIGKKI